MGQARCNRRGRIRAKMDNADLSGFGVPRYGSPTNSQARLRKLDRKKAKAARLGRTYGFNKKG